MKQVLQSYRTGELWLAEVPTPACDPGGVVVRTAASLVSAGTEKMIVELAKKSLLAKARSRPDLVKQVVKKIKSEGLSPTLTKVFAKLDQPIALGYSAAGVVHDAGPEAGPFRVGDRVACGGAGYATHAEFNGVPRNLCARIPDGVSFEDASFATVGTIAMQGVRQADLRLGECVAVVGLGLLGLLTVQILLASGCRVIGSDPDPERCKQALALGAHAAVNSAELESAAMPWSRGRGVDAVVITAATSSNGPIETAAEISRKKGRVVVVGMVGMQVPRDPFYKKELDLRLSMSYGPGRYDPQYEEAGHDYPIAYVRWTEQRNMEAFLDLVAQGLVTPAALTTHHFAIEDALDGYDLMQGRSESGEREKYLGIVIRYPGFAEAKAPVETEKPELRSAAREVAVAEGGKIGVGLIGAGNFARGVLLPELAARDDVKFVGVCTTTGMSASETQKKFGFDLATTEAKQLLERSDLHAVVIATRHNTHSELVTQALRAGKHVFVEKPLAINDSQLQALTDQLELDPTDGTPAGPCLMVGFNRRFSSHAAVIRETFVNRRSPLFVDYRVNAGPIPSDSWIHDPGIGGGRIVGEVCHFVDFCRFVVGSDPVNVQAMALREGDELPWGTDSLSINVQYADGSLANIKYFAHGASQINKERCEVSADGITAVMDNFSRTDFYGTSRKPLRGKLDKGFAAEFDAFLKVCRGAKDWPISWGELLGTTRTTFAVQRSLNTGELVWLDPLLAPTS